MPHHVALAHLALLTGPATALAALLYPLLPRHRSVVRWTMVVLAVVTTVLALMAGEAAKELLDQLRAQGASAAELSAAQGHGKDADGILMCAGGLTLLGPLSALRRFGGRWTAWVIGLVGVALLGALWVTVGSAAEAVWLGRGW